MPIPTPEPPVNVSLLAVRVGALVEKLVDQQAMADDWWRDDWKKLRAEIVQVEALLVQRTQAIEQAEAEFAACYRQRGEELLHWIRRADALDAALTARTQALERLERELAEPTSEGFTDYGRRCFDAGHRYGARWQHRADQADQADAARISRAPQPEQVTIQSRTLAEALDALFEAQTDLHSRHRQSSLVPINDCAAANCRRAVALSQRLTTEAALLPASAARPETTEDGTNQARVVKGIGGPATGSTASTNGR